MNFQRFVEEKMFIIVNLKEFKDLMKIVEENAPEMRWNSGETPEYMSNIIEKVFSEVGAKKLAVAFITKDKEKSSQKDSLMFADASTMSKIRFILSMDAIALTYEEFLNT